MSPKQHDTDQMESALPVILFLLTEVCKGELTESMAATKSLVRVMEMVNKEQVEKHLKEIVMALTKVRDKKKLQVVYVYNAGL